MKPKKVRELLATYYDQNRNNKLDKGEFLIFDIGRDAEKIGSFFGDPRPERAQITIYNPTKPIYRQGQRFLIGRVEPEENEQSRLMFFEEFEGVWRLVDEAPVLGLQDPFHVENVQGWHIIGGVQTVYRQDASLGYRTVFYRYESSIQELIENQTITPPFAVGPENMKDIRLIQLPTGQIGLFTRPQGGEAGLGKIAYIEIKRLEDLESSIPKANIIKNQFHDDEWGGVNELHLLKNGKIGVLGHIAHFDDSVRHYYAMAFVFDPRTKRATHMEILTTADDFPSIKPKRSQLGKVIFSGGLVRNEDGSADLYVGIGDIASGRIRIHDPFLKYEQNV